MPWYTYGLGFKLKRTCFAPLDVKVFIQRNRSNPAITSFYSIRLVLVVLFLLIDQPSPSLFIYFVLYPFIFLILWLHLISVSSVVAMSDGRKLYPIHLPLQTLVQIILIPGAKKKHLILTIYSYSQPSSCIACGWNHQWLPHSAATHSSAECGCITRRLLGRGLCCYSRMSRSGTSPAGIQLRTWHSDWPDKQWWSREGAITTVCFFFPTYFLVSCYCMLCLFSLLLSIYTNTTMGTDRLCVFRVILDSSARRFQAHRIYLRIAAAKRWALNRRTILRGQRPTAQNMAELNNVGNTLQQVGTSPSLPFPSWFSVPPRLWSGLANLFELGTGADNGSIRCLRSSSSRPAGRSLAWRWPVLAYYPPVDSNPPLMKKRYTNFFLSLYETRLTMMCAT